MALSDMLNEAGLEIEAGADIYEESCMYSDDYIAWVRQLGELCKRAAGCIRDCEPLVNCKSALANPSSFANRLQQR